MLLGAVLQRILKISQLGDLVNVDLTANEALKVILEPFEVLVELTTELG